MVVGEPGKGNEMKGKLVVVDGGTVVAVSGAGIAETTAEGIVVRAGAKGVVVGVNDAIDVVTTWSSSPSPMISGAATAAAAMSAATPTAMVVMNNRDRRRFLGSGTATAPFPSSLTKLAGGSNCAKTGSAIPGSPRPDRAV